MNLLQSRKFTQVSQMMDHSKINRLANDDDSSLSANSMLNYIMLIKQKRPSLEGKLIEGFINRKLYDDMHRFSNDLFDLPLTEGTQREWQNSILSKNDPQLLQNTKRLRELFSDTNTSSAEGKSKDFTKIDAKSK